MKRIPFIAQMKALDFERYKVQYRQDGRLEAGMPVIDGRDQEALPGNSETVMQIDYKFLQDGLFLPDDSGKPNSRNQSYLKNKFYKLLKQT